jgi:hypothetical protein
MTMHLSDFEADYKNGFPNKAEPRRQHDRHRLLALTAIVLSLRCHDNSRVSQ